jgi:ferredoxin
MVKRYCLLLKNGTPTLTILPDDADARPSGVLLAGGFPSREPGSSVPLSPALELNCHLADLDNDTLTRIALAEEERLARSRVQNYVLKIEPRAAVISDNAEALSAFLDTWGGVLETMPLLFSENQQADFTTVFSVDINPGRESECLVLARSRSPVDTERCTWCGKCGQACAEKCIDPWLNIDFTQCTFCGQCSDVCPEGAIDIHAVAETGFECQAVILVGAPPVSVGSSCRDMIFPADRGMDRFFRRVGSYQVEERISLTSSLCQYISRLDLGCRHCLEQCAYGALSIGSGGIDVDHLKCTDCGNCVASCPTGSLQSEALRDTLFVDWLGRACTEPGFSLVMGSEDALMRLYWYCGDSQFANTVFMEHPSVNSLTMMHFLFLFAIGIRNVILLDDEKKVMDSTSARSLEAEGTGEILNTLFGVENFVQHCSPRKIPELTPGSDTDILENRYSDFSFSSRRQKLVSVLEFLRDKAGTDRVEFTGPAFTTFGLIELDTEICTTCLACLNACMTGALASDPENFRLIHEPAKCVQCGACAATCPENALKLRPGLVLDDTFFKSSALIETEPMICRDCGAMFGTKESYRHVTAVLESRGMFAESADVLQYCETCRARRIFEKGT